MSQSSSSSSGGTSVMTAVWFIVGALCSFLINKSVFWALVHGIFGPFYVLYLCLGCGGGIDGVQQAVDQFTAPAVEQVQVEIIGSDTVAPTEAPTE